MTIKAYRNGGGNAGRGDNPHGVPNAVSKWEPYPTPHRKNAQHAVISEDVYFDSSDQSGYDDDADYGDNPWGDKSDERVQPLDASVEQVDGGRWLSRVYRPSSNYSFQAYGQTAEGPEFEKTFRTEKRAKIAAEAMINRRNQGLDFKTGRGPQPGWTPGSPY